MPFDPTSYVSASGHRLRRLPWGWQYRMMVLVPQPDRTIRICDASHSTAHADGKRDLGCSSCTEPNAPRHASWSAAIAAVDATHDALVASGFFPSPVRRSN
jgi:hypothetical protein